jgi:hypothetical protein
LEKALASIGGREGIGRGVSGSQQEGKEVLLIPWSLLQCPGPLPIPAPISGLDYIIQYIPHAWTNQGIVALANLCLSTP